ncbi:TetR/AcrR family transcriptional regulator [Pseudomaricurvus alcaniphilus]|uniref:TetR/AcrR family transcriptional regulator n=1 Tax=Pseudomaricurvus alcaniphilus TaxID=1166482 RepID=UPI00140C09E4|nr:TetR/AcrR family transcriptional regulator [Pseudomaricurvus alcaniphilus]NHN36860.1 TetR/AcrR family transcriptional regulator [Pseudomaricurvus alcaniphilus]
MSKSIGITNPPKQKRSRLSLEKVIKAASALMAERGDDSFTLQEVAQKSGVAVGTLYGRIASKRELVWAVMDEVYRLRVPRQTEMINRLDAYRGLKPLIPMLIDEWAEELRQDALVVRAIMSCAAKDPVVETRGRTIHREQVASLSTLILKYRKEIKRPDPEKAIEHCLVVTYSALARFLGFGTAADVAGEGDWESLKAELGIMALAYLSWRSP